MAPSSSEIYFSEDEDQDDEEEEFEHFDDFTLASSWERFISEIEAVCRQWLADGPKKLLEKSADCLEISKNLYKVKSELKYLTKNYCMDYYFVNGGNGSIGHWNYDLHDLQLSFGVEEFLVIAPQSASGVVLDAPEASKLLSAVAIALSNSSSLWPAFVPVHVPSRKAYIGIQNMGTVFTRRFESDRIGSQVPVKLMHLEGLYELFISKFVFSTLDLSMHRFKVNFTMKLTYKTILHDDENEVERPNAEVYDSNAVSGSEMHRKAQWDEDCPWSEWYSAEDPVKDFDLIIIWTEKTIESSLEMAELENASLHEADKWIITPTFSQNIIGNSVGNIVGFASQLRLLVNALYISSRAKYIEDYVSAESLGSDDMRSSAIIPPPTVLDRVLKDIFHEGKRANFSDVGDKTSRNIKGAPLESLFAQFCLHSLWFGDCNIRAIAVLWIEFVREVRWCWEESQPLPRMLGSGSIDLSTCLVNQKLQMLAICIEKVRQQDKESEDGIESEESVSAYAEDDITIGSESSQSPRSGNSFNRERDSSLSPAPPVADIKSPSVMTSASLKNTDSAMSGSAGIVGSMMLLNSRQYMHAPFTQDAPIMTEDMHEERLRAAEALGDFSFSAQLEKDVLLSDMSAFKAANPDAVFEDFIRWHSPKDWEEDTQDGSNAEGQSETKWPPRGRLSARMSDNANSWRKIWNEAPALSVSNQKPLLDPNREGEKDLTTGKVLGSGKLVDGLYVMESNSVSPLKSYQVSSKSNPVLESLYQWHRRLGHPSFSVLAHLFPKLTSKCNKEEFFCEPCELAKHKRSSYPSKNKRSSTLFSTIHTDVWGPFRHPTHDGYRWFVVFVDCHSRLTWVYLLKHKSEVFECFKSFHHMIQTQFKASVKILRSDNGTEYHGSFTSYLDTYGIIHQTTCVKTSQQNGVAERKIGHLQQVARSLMLTMHVPKYLWGEAVMTAAYLINRVPSTVLQFKTPLSFVPAPSTHPLPLRLFGSVCFVHNHCPSRDKLDSRALRCVFIGYSPTQKGYKCYHPPSHRTFVSHDVTFWESISYFSPGSSSLLQGEINRHSLDSEVIEESLPFTNMPIPNCPDPNTSPITNPNTFHPHFSSESDDLSRFEKPDLITYSRRRNNDITSLPLPETSDLEADPTAPVIEPDNGNTLDPTLNLPIAIRKGIRSCTNHPISNFVSYNALSPSSLAFVSSLSSVSIPRTWQDALCDLKWKDAMMEEMNALKHNGTWELTHLPAGRKVVGCRWVFTVKQKPNGMIDRYKARLVAKGYTQSYGIDYQETFAPVAKMASIRVLISCAANLGWELQQLDVKNAFLHGDLKEEVYMDIPPGFFTSATIGKVCKLKKTIYGLKQSPRVWFGKFQRAIVKFGYKQSNSDSTMFVKRKGEKITVLIVYVDDIVITGNDTCEIADVKRRLASEFEMKDLGELRYFLGIEVSRSPGGIFLSQRKYTLDLLNETGMLGCRPADSPIEANHKLCGDVGDIVDRFQYQRLVGRLIYLSHTRPDIAYAVGVVSRYMHDPRQPHLDAVYMILRYLKAAPGKGVMFTKNNHLGVESYTDADWAGCLDDRRSTSGYCTFVGGNLVTWRSKKQPVVALSSAEAEYRAMARGVRELLWIRLLLTELGLALATPMKLHCDSKAAIAIAHDPVQHDRTKHIEIDRHFIKEKINNDIISIQFVKSEDQVADILTKGLGGKMLHPLMSKLGMSDIYAST